MSHFDKEITSAVVPALFVLLIISSGGSWGSRAISLLIHSLAARDISSGMVESRCSPYVSRRESRSVLACDRLRSHPGAGIGSPDQLRSTLSISRLTVWLSLIGVVEFGTLGSRGRTSIVGSCGRGFSIAPAAAVERFRFDHFINRLEYQPEGWLVI